MQKKLIPVVIHLTGWILFISLPLILFTPPAGGNRPYPIHDGLLWHLLPLNLFLIGFFYLNYHVLIPRLYLSRKYLWYALMIVLSFLLLCLVLYLFDMRAPEHMPHRPGPFERFRFRLFPGFFYFMLILLLSSLLRITQRWLYTERQRKEIANSQLQAELSYLKAQVNPHFLFNTLNNIYSLALAQSEHTAEAVIRLSDMMRYVIQDAQAQVVPLTSEIRYLTHYIELQQLRLTPRTSIEFDTGQQNLDGYEIAPLLLIPFVENAFKYGISNHEDTLIRIMINVENNSFYFMITNTIIPRLQQIHQTSTGLRNTRRRLELAYPGKHILNITKTDQAFTVQLKIELV